MLCCIGKSSCLIWFDLDVYTGWYMLKQHAFNRDIHGTKDDHQDWGAHGYAVTLTHAGDSWRKGTRELGKDLQMS